MSIFALLVIMLITGCERTRFTPNDFEGIWRVEASNRASGIANSMTISLDHNGSFVAKCVPYGFLQLDDVNPEKVVSGNGTWSLTQQQGAHETRLRLTFTTVDGIKSRDLPYGAELFIERVRGQNQLFYFKGDPDENQRVVFWRGSPPA